MAMRKVLGSAMLAAWVLLPCGCATSFGTADVTGSSYAYALGQGTGWFAADFADTWHATEEALAGLALPVTGVQRHRLAGTLSSTTPEGAGITLELAEQPLRPGVPEHQTEVRIRVGLLGDPRITQHLLEQIQWRLDARRAAMPPPPAPTVPPPVPPQERAPGR